MLNLIGAAHWDELYAFFAKGNPPLIFQLLLLNTIFFILLISRRMRGAPALRSSTASTIQALLIIANMGLIFQDSILIAMHKHGVFSTLQKILDSLSR